MSMRACVGPGAFVAAGLDRRGVYATNAVKHFKYELRGKRRIHKTPTQREVEACEYWLERELQQVQPRVIVTLGATALRAVYPEFKRGLVAEVRVTRPHLDRAVPMAASTLRGRAHQDGETKRFARIAPRARTGAQCPTVGLPRRKDASRSKRWREFGRVGPTSAANS